MSMEAKQVYEWVKTGHWSLREFKDWLAEAEKQEPVTWGVDWGKAGDTPCVSIIKRLPDGRIEVVAAEYAPYTNPQPKREPPTPREVKDVLRATGLLTNSQSWDAAEEVMKLLAAHGITSDMKQEHVDKTAKQRHKENT